MSLLRDQKPGFIPKLESSGFFDVRLSPVFPHPVFLMVNSLETGGSERQFVEMTRALRNDGTPVHLGCLHNKGAFGDGLGELSEFDLGGSLYGLQSLRSRWRLQRHLRMLGIAVAHAFDFYTNLTLIPAAKLAGICVVGSHRQLGDLLTRAQFSAQLAVFRLCDRVVCNSRAAAERLLEAGLPDRKVVVIGNALSPEAFAEVTPALARAPGVFRIGMIARMNSEYKNHRRFLRAAKQVEKKNSNLEFVLVGDGPLRADLEREADELGLRRRVQFLGDRRDVPAVLRSLDLSVVPSASEIRPWLRSYGESSTSTQSPGKMRMKFMDLTRHAGQHAVAVLQARRGRGVGQRFDDALCFNGLFFGRCRGNGARLFS